MTAIETRGLSKAFGTNKALDNMNISIPVGTICGFLGKNGAGKTTAIKMMVGLSKPTAGTISVMGQERLFGKCENSRIGYLPDVPNFYGYMTAREYLGFCAKLYHMEQSKIPARIGELLNQVGLHDVKTRISGFSRGMKQRLGIAQALINRPDVVFMDEPISALDPIGRHEVMEIVRNLRGSVTVFFSTHILADVENTCDHVLILDKGKIKLDGRLADIRRHYLSNTAKIRFFSVDDSDRFCSLLNGHAQFSAEKITPLEYLLHTKDMQALGKMIPVILSESNISLESYQAHTPSLEDIFMEVTGNA